MKLTQKIYFAVVKLFYPLLRFLENIYVKQTNKEHIFSRFYEILSYIKAGDIMLTVSDLHATNLVNIGKWKHAIVYSGEIGGIPTVVEAVGEGVVERSLIECLASKDKLIILRPTEKLLHQHQIGEFLEFVRKQVGKPYDYNFDNMTGKKLDTFYCSELVYEGVTHANPEAEFNLRDFYGVHTVTPTDLFNMSAEKVGKFKVILEIYQ